MNYIILTLVFVIILMLYFAYIYISNTTLSTGVEELKSPSTSLATIEWTKLSDPGSETYHYEAWLFLNTLPSSKQYLFSRGSTKFALALNGSTLTVETSTTAPSSNTGTPTGTPYIKATITDNFPNQKWVYVVINVINNNIIEGYLNGKLLKTVQLVGLASPPSNTSPLEVGNTDVLKVGGSALPEGVITKFKRDPVALLPDDVWKNYLNGNGLATFSNLLAGYNASFSVFTATEEVKKYTLL